MEVHAEICPTCGVLVVGIAKHRQWHTDLRGLLERVGLGEGGYCEWSVQTGRDV